MAIPERISRLIDTVAADHQITRLEMLCEYHRGGPARYDCWWRIRTGSPDPPSYPMIGKWFGKHHTTILKGVRRWQEHADACLAEREAA